MGKSSTATQKTARVMCRVTAPVKEKLRLIAAAWGISDADAVARAIDQEFERMNRKQRKEAGK